jgi:DNA polymerase
MTKKYTRKDTYGGKIIENIIQATARDLLASALLGAERKGYKPVMHVHDEIVVEVPEGVGSTKEFEKIICAAPAWGKGCPISAEAERVKRYRKG